MSRRFACFVILFALVSIPAFALTTDHSSGMNSDGTPKFADPDEQQPAFMDSKQGQNQGGHFYMQQSVTPGLSILQGDPSFNQAPDAFDQAYSRK